VGNRWLSVFAGLIGVWSVSMFAADTSRAADATGEVSGFVDLAAGYQRLPNPGAQYMDADSEVAGGADPRWKPWNPQHLAVAEARAKGPSPGVRNATQHAYLLSLRGDRAGAEAGLASAKQRYPDAVGVYWSEGWIRLNLLDFEGALVAWQQAERLHGGQPFWVPYSKAIALMGVGDGAAALAWWQVAQRAYTPELDTAMAARNRFQHWRTTEKALLEEVIDLAYPGEAAAVAKDGSGIEMIDMPIPHYPPTLARQGIQGVTMVRIKVDAAGLPLDATVEQSSGYAEMDAEALKVARLARFKVPAGTAPDGHFALVPYRFSLDPASLAPPPAGSRQAEIERIIEQRREQMREEAAKAQNQQPAG
jgi:TonB family protein